MYYPPTNPSTTDAGLLNRTLNVADFEDVERTYWVQAPPQPSEPASLLVAFHGQTQQADAFGLSHQFGSLGKDHNLMTVFPQGMDDSSPGEDQGTGWNTGSNGNNQTCVPGGVGIYGGCYRSCRALKKCGRCNWSTCYDDVLFVKTLINTVAQDFCVDLDRVYAHGESNGAMMVHHLVRELPSTFAGVSTWFGTPLLGLLLGSRLQLVSQQLPLSRTAVLAMHGRSDTTIPAIGGVQDQGWLYEPLDQSQGVWAGLHHCSEQATPLATRWQGGPLNFQCSEHQKCATGRRIVQCMYDGVHGDWPTGPDGQYCGDQMTLWFLFQFDRSIPLAPVANPKRATDTEDDTKDEEAPTLKEKADVTKAQATAEAAEAAASATAKAKEQQKDLGGYLNRQKPKKAPARPTTPKPTNPPVKITAEEIAARLP